MLIEPTPALSSSGAARRRRGAALAVPIAALLIVTGVGWFAGGDSASVRPSDSPVPSLAHGGVTSAAPAAVPSVEATAFPERAVGLPVRSVTDILARRRAGDLGDEVVAIAGHLTTVPGWGACLSIPDAPTIQTTSPCGTDAVLSDSPEPLIEWAVDGFAWRAAPDGPHLHASAFPITDLAALSGRPTTRPQASAVGAAIPAVAAVILGRFGDARVADRRSNDRHPNEAFVIERIAWLDGAWQPRGATRYADMPPEAVAIEQIRASAAAAFPGGAAVIGHVFVDPVTLARVDVLARGGLRAGVTRLGMEDPLGVWYVRVMRREGGSEPALARDAVPWRLGWVVVAADGLVLASAIDG